MAIIEVYDNPVLASAIADARHNATIVDSFVKANSVINNPKYNSIICSVSGGADSDVMMDICMKVDKYRKITYVWFDTGLEFQATKDHIDYLEQKYNVNIHREKAVKSIPYVNRTIGQPFVSKYVSNQISKLQKNNFQWEDESYEVLIEKYPSCTSAIKWWTNSNEKRGNEQGRFNIAYNKYLKEFLIENPPYFPITWECCKYAKKDVSKELVKRYNADLIILGLRKAEGGIRSIAFKDCYTIHEDQEDTYRPIFWYTKEDKDNYCELFNITHSDCYTVYGMRRTGCAGCPYDIHLNRTLPLIEEYEPKLYKACTKVFAKPYEYTKAYREFFNKKSYEDWYEKRHQEFLEEQELKKAKRKT